MLLQFVCLSALVAISSAGIIGGIDGGLGGGAVGGYGGHGHVVDFQTPPKYEFKYGVADPKTGDKKQQSEVRVGDVVKGEYSLVEPDGTIRVVKYTADDHNGFNAVVSRVGHAAHPQVVIKKAIVPVQSHGIAVSGISGGLGGIGIGSGLGGGYGGGYEGSGLGGFGGLGGGSGIGGGIRNGLGGHSNIGRY